MSEKPLEMKHFRVLLCPKAPEPAPPLPPESFEMGKNDKDRSKRCG